MIIHRYNKCARLVACVVLLGGAAGSAVAATAPDAARLLAEMQGALAPAKPQIARVHVTTKENDSMDERDAWDALVVRRRFDDGPRTAIAMTRPDDAHGTVILTAPLDDNAGRGLWVYEPAERRTRELTPLEPDQHFLLTDFNYADLALATFPLQGSKVLGEVHLDGRAAWKVEAVPASTRQAPYSRIVSWVAEDTKLPLRREYYDRAGRLWKVLSYRGAIVDSVPTILDVRLRDAQSGATSTWEVRALSYEDPGHVARTAFEPERLGSLSEQDFWQDVR